MIYPWCTQCGDRVCLAENSHRASKLVQYRADFMIGGRYGKRIRKLFPTKKDAEAFEYITLADFKRGTFLPSSESKLTYEEFFSRYLELYINRHMKGAKEEEYRLRAFGEMFNHRPIKTLVLNDWNLYVNNRINSIGKTTLNRELTSIKTMFNWAIKNKFLSKNPFEDAVKFKEDIIKIRWLDEKEIEAILTKCTIIKDLDLRDILEIALNTGFRKANLETITAHDIINQRIAARRTKSGKEYQVPISQTLGKLLQRLCSTKPTGPLLNFSNFRKRFATLIKDPTITLHTFRHTFAAQCLKKGIPIDRVCSWMGHHSVEFTRKHYGHLCPSQEALEIELLNLGKLNKHNNVDSLLTQQDDR